MELAPLFSTPEDDPFSIQLAASSLPKPPPEGPALPVGNESAITPKRKRIESGEDKDVLETPTKRSNLEKGLIPDSFDSSSPQGSFDNGSGNKDQQLTPMRRSITSAATTTPKTTVTNFNGLELDSSSPTHGAALGRSPTPLASGALSPLIRPRISDYTSTPEAEVDGVSSPGVNVVSSSSSLHGREDHHSSTPPPTNMSFAHVQDQETNDAGFPTPQPTPRKDSTTATSATTPQKPTSKLHSTPVIAPAYVPEYISTDSHVKLKDPKQFCVHPPFWKRWPAHRYARFATFLQETINLVPFAEQEGLTVEEAQHVFHAVVTEPLLDETEKLADVGTKRMEGIFRVLNSQVGLTKWRKWGSEVSSVKGEVCGVRPGVVQLVGEEGQLIEVPFMKLGKADFEFVLKLVTKEERSVLLRQDTSD